jgi:nucleoside-diphosphate-sugar epimerase
LVHKLVDAGERVTIATRGRAADEFGESVKRLVVDRRDGEALRRVAASQDHDLVFDQTCYSPLDARRSAEAFAGRTGRYVVASTIEVYQPLVGVRHGDFAEHELPVPDEDAIDHDARWDQPAWADSRYGDGKYRAESWFARDGRLPVVAVRIAHVLGGPEDFTGRLAAHVRAAIEGRALALAAPSPGASSFIDCEGIATFLQWIGGQDATGAVNAAADGVMDAATLHRRVGSVLERPVEIRMGERGRRPANAVTVDAGASTRLATSPFDYPARFAMDTTRARELGHRFGPIDGWLDGLIRQLAVTQGLQVR